LGVLGLLGVVLKQDAFYALFGFSAFVVLFSSDERTEHNFGRAAGVAFVATLVGFTATFVWLGVMLRPEIRAISGLTAGDLAGVLALGLGIVYGVHLLSFALSWIYFELRGN